jgi:DNA-binding response OmpR family regulator/DNA-binding transcriptional ArsR family regulator
VEDDAEVVEQIEDTLCSIRHDFDWVVTQQDARKALEAEDFDYVLLDLEIPAKSPKGKPSKEFGANVLADIRRIKRDRRPPVIVMSGHVGFCLNHSNELRERGATQFIAKPFPTEERTLASVIRDVLATHEQPSSGKTSGKDNGKPQPFSGGQLVFFDDRAQLLGVKIISDGGTGLTLRILREFGKRFQGGRYIPISAEELSRILSVPDVNLITGCIRGLRRNIVDRLRKHLNVETATNDVICRDEQGYYLRDWITVVHGDDTEVPADVTVKPTCSHDLNERQKWVLTELERGTKVDRAMLEKRFGVADKTAKRDLASLSRRGLITYVRDGRGGFYRLASSLKGVL